MKNLISTFFVIILLNTWNTFAINQTEWINDIDSLYINLPEKHIDFYKIIDSVDFKNRIENLKNSIADLNDFEITIELQKLIAGFGVAHTSIMFPKSMLNKVFPIRFALFDDGLFIVSIAESKKEFLNKKVVAINSIPIDTVYKNMSSIIAYENEYWLKKSLPEFLPLPEFVKYLNGISQSDTLKYNLENGEYIAFNEDFSNEKMDYNKELFSLSILRNRKKFYRCEIPDSNTLYIQYNSCTEYKKYPIKKFVRDIDSLMKCNNFQKVIVDLRNNTGGNSEIINPLIGLLIKQKDLKFYTCISRSTFSSGRMVAIKTKKYLGSELIGEPTGGSPNSYGDVSSFNLPNSGLNVHYSTKHFDLLKNEENTIKPDIYIEFNSKDYLKGIDPVLEYILK